MTLDFAKYTLLCEFEGGRTEPAPDFDEASEGKLDHLFTSSLSSSSNSNTNSDNSNNNTAGRSSSSVEAPRQLVLRVQLPRLRIEARSEVQLSMSSQLVVVSAPGYRRLEVVLPLPVKREGVTACFDGLVSCVRAHAG